MKVIVLGAAAGGGFPQWNAASPNNLLAFAGNPATPRLTQCSLAVSVTGSEWLLLHASPDLRAQILATPELHPKSPPRSSPIAAVAVTNADVDAVAGLLTLRERHAFTLFATPYVRRAIEANPAFNVLDRTLVRFETIERAFTPLPGLEAEIFDAPGKPPLWLEAVEGIGRLRGACSGLRLRHHGKSLVFLPSCAAVTPEILAAVDGAGALFFDGTMYTDDEMLRSGEGAKTAARMGHMAMVDAIAALRDVKVGERWFVHVNNSNPVLHRDAPERRAVEAAGWRIAHDGLRIGL